MVCSLSAVRVGSSGYYTELIAHDDYYKDHGEARGVFFGKGAERLHLADHEIGKEDKTLHNLFQGVSPEGEKLRHVSLKVRTYEKEVKDPETGTTKKVREEVKPVLGWDFTFSAPKSVSVLWSQASPEARAKIEDCQRAAVKEASTHLESFTAVRTGRGGTEKEKADAIFAAFQHGTSRALDPQLHTHVVLLNTAIKKDGKGGALDARPFFKERFAAGQIYRNALERELTRELGIETVRTTVGKQLDAVIPTLTKDDPDRKFLQNAPSFEIKGVPPKLVHEFSKRREAMQSALSGKENPSYWDKQLAILKTRDKKEAIPREKLFTEWKEVGKSHDFQWKTCVNRDKAPNLDRSKLEEMVQKVSKKLSFAPEIDAKKIRNVVLSEEKGRFSAAQRQEFIATYKETYLQPCEIKVTGKEGKITYGLNDQGIKTASYNPDKMNEVRHALKSMYYAYKRVTHQVKNTVYRLKEMSFTAKAIYLYATHRMSKAKYEELTSGKGLPKTKSGIEWKYATHQISRAQRDQLLKQNDPDRQQKAEERERKRTEKRELAQERVFTKEKQIEELRDKGLITDYVAKEAKAGRIAMAVIERDLQQRGKLKKEEPKESAKPERDPRVESLLSRKLINEQTADAIDRGKLAYEDAENYLKRLGRLHEKDARPPAQDSPSPQHKQQEPREKEQEHEHDR